MDLALTEDDRERVDRKLRQFVMLWSAVSGVVKDKTFQSH